MKHIAFFNSLSFWGGGEKLHLDNALAFKDLGYDVSVFSLSNSPLWKQAKANKLQCVAIRVRNLSFLNPFKLEMVATLLRKHRIDTIIFSSSQDFKLASLAAKRAHVPRIVYLRGLAVPIKNTFVNRWIFKHCLTHLIPNSEETLRQIFVKMGKEVTTAKTKVIYHGIEPHKHKYKAGECMEVIAQEGKGVILANAGRLTEQKGQAKLIEMAKLLKQKALSFTLFIAGTGEEHASLHALIEQYQLQKEVKLLGFVEDMELFMNSIDVFLLSSSWEGFGYVLVEAMAKAKPVVAFNITSNPEIVEDNKTAYLVEYPNVDAFANKVAHLIQDNNLRQQMGKAGKERVYSHFILQDKVKEIEAFLNTKTEG